MSLTRPTYVVAPRSAIRTMRIHAPVSTPVERSTDTARASRLRGHPARILVALGVACALLVSAAQPSAALSAVWPVQDYGGIGTNVRALQYLLRHRGYDLPPTGWFGPMTYSAVRSFQGRVGLARTGYVNRTTWLRLAPELRYGARNQAVRAVQTLLNKKLAAGLAVDGVFGAYTRSAVRAFQSNHGLEADGIVGSQTWRWLIWHFERPAFARASICAYPTGANGHRAHWGTAGMVGALESAGADVYAAGHGPVAIGDLSLESGGNIAGHVTHEQGLDADIRPMRRDHAQCSVGVTWYRWSGGRKVCCNPAYDRDATRRLAKELREESWGHLDLIAFNDPQLVKEGLTIYFAGHDDHLHATFCERNHPVALYSC
jgi:peptidoglycan hydrolase-like protein with peptidoglycan-binding domain